MAYMNKAHKGHVRGKVCTLQMLQEKQHEARCPRIEKTMKDICLREGERGRGESEQQ